MEEVRGAEVEREKGFHMNQPGHNILTREYSSVWKTASYPIPRPYPGVASKDQNLLGNTSIPGPPTASLPPAPCPISLQTDSIPDVPRAPTSREGRGNTRHGIWKTLPGSRPALHGHGWGEAGSERRGEAGSERRGEAGQRAPLASGRAAAVWKRV